MLEAPQGLGQRMFSGRRDHEKGHRIAALPRTAKREVRASADWLQDVLRST
jgi:hypothetical protein